MARSKANMEKRKPARKLTESAVRLPAELVNRIDVWAGEHDVNTRADAIRKLVELGLAVKSRCAASAKQRERAAALAAGQIDQMADVSASKLVRAERKQRLTEGPSVFRAVRQDRPKKRTQSNTRERAGRGRKNFQ
jgi:Arc/MetJ-type ribon-helix-helix transcriptional regulator